MIRKIKKDDLSLTYSDLKAGDRDPYLGRMIKEIIMSSNDFIVFIDDQDTIQWATSGIELKNDLGKIQNKISQWESTCNRFLPKKDAYEYKSLLAEGYARLFDERKLGSAEIIVNQTIDSIKKRVNVLLEQQYLYGSLIPIIIITIAIIYTLINKTLVYNFFQDAFDIYCCGIVGGVGGFISTMIRMKNYKADIETTKKIHLIDGMLRVIYGIIAGCVIALGIKSDIIFGFVKEKSLYTMLFLSMIGGASEIILPNIIKQVEDNI
jgi:hypothetical protein